MCIYTCGLSLEMQRAHPSDEGDRQLTDKRHRRKIICGGCGERVLEETAMEAYRTAQDGYTRFRDHPIAGGTLAFLCPHCYDEWDVATDGLPASNERR